MTTQAAPCKGKHEQFELRQNAMELKLHNQILKFEKHIDKEDERWDRVISAQQANTEAIGKLTESTAGLVNTWTAAQGVIKVGNTMGKFAKWLTSIAVLGAAFAWLLDKFVA